MGQKDDDRAATSHAPAASFLVALIAAAGWAVPLAGPVVPTAVAVGMLVLAPTVFGWGWRVQSLVAAIGIAGFAWLAPAGDLSATLSGVVALVLGSTCSLVGTVEFDRQRSAERVEQQRFAARTQEALATLATRASAAVPATQTPEERRAGSASQAGSDPVATVERIGAAFDELRRQHRRELLRDREMNAHFIGQASHEFRTPLSVIQTAADALKLYSGRMSSALQQDRLTKIEEAVQEMTKLLHNALTFSRVDAGKIKCERGPVDLRALGREVVRDVQANLGEREIGLTIRGTARLPQLDASLTREILSNLLTNAVKYSPDGGKIDVDIMVGEADVQIRVADEGIGIKPEDQAKVFEAFGRGGNVRSIPGTGLGLAITKRAAEVHGGTITLESRHSGGTMFTVTLPEGVELGQPAQRRTA